MNTGLFKLLTHHHNVYAGLAIADPGKDCAVGVDHAKELGGVAADSVLFVDAHGAVEPEEDTGEVEVYTVATVEISGYGAVLVEIRAVSRSGGAHEAAEDCAIEKLVGVDEGGLPTHSF